LKVQDNQAAKGPEGRGSAQLEAALVFLPFLALVLGIIDFSMATLVRNTLTNAVREGVRFGVTGRTISGLGHDASIKSVVQRHAFGFLNGAANANRISISYFDPRTGTSPTGPNSNRSGNVLEVRVVAYPWSWIAPMWRSRAAMSFGAASADLMEFQPNGPPNR
jgi:hypothetical protein